MASARQAQLAEQRRASKSLQFGDSRRVLSPSSNSIASISRKTTTAELEAMISKYNDGLIGNDEMRSFLQKSVNAPGLTSSDKTDLDQQIRDFDSRVQKDQLEAQYKGAQDNSIAKVQAASALAAFYQTRAASMVPGTPAHSQAIENQGVWQNSAVELQQKAATLQRRNLRYSEEQKINQLPNNSAERSYSKAQMYKKLYDQATADGDPEDANKYASYYQQELTNAEEKATRESDQENKKQLSDFINTTINEYHDGKISGDEALAKLEEADKFAYDTGDTAAQNRLNSLSVTINREVEKGVVYSNVNGLSVKSKGGGSGGGELYLNPDGSVSVGGGSSSTRNTTGSIGTKIGVPTTGKAVMKESKLGGSGDTPKSVSELAIEYKNNLNEANRALTEGKVEVDGKIVPYTAKDYKNDIIAISKNRQLQLQNINTGLLGMQEAGVKKVGSKQLKTLLDEATGELTNVTSEYNGLRTGNLVLAMKDASFTNASGVKINKPQLQFVGKDQVGSMLEVNGVYQPMRSEPIIFNADQEKEAKKFIEAQGEDGLTYQAGADGKLYITYGEGGEAYKRDLVDIRDTDGNVITYEKHKDYGYIPLAVGPKTGALRKQMVKEADEAKKSKGTYEPRLMNYNEVVNFDYKTPVGQTLPAKPQPPTALENVATGVKNVINQNQVKPAKVLQAVNNPIGAVINAGVNAVAPAVKQAVTNFGKTPTPTPISPNQASFNSIGTKAPEPIIKVPQQAKNNPVVKQELNKAVPVKSTQNFNPQPQTLLQKAGNVVNTVVDKNVNAFNTVKNAAKNIYSTVISKIPKFW